MNFSSSIPAGTVVLLDGVPYRLMTATLVESVEECELANADWISHD